LSVLLRLTIVLSVLLRLTIVLSVLLRLTIVLSVLFRLTIVLSVLLRLTIVLSVLLRLTIVLSVLRHTGSDYHLWYLLTLLTSPFLLKYREMIVSSHVYGCYGFRFCLCFYDFRMVF
jgi:hypothetical protein